MQELDPRLVRISVQVNKVVKIYDQNLTITAVGTKYGNPLQNECEITLTNLDKETQDFILTETSPYTRNRTPKSIIVEAGRVSYGLSKIYEGNIVTAVVSQPPDLKLTLKCLTGNFLKGNILSRNFPGQASFFQVSQQVANDTNTLLSFQATDKNLANYAYSGSALKQVDHISDIGGYGTNVFIDDNILVVKDAFIPLNNSLRILNADSGMIGIPEFTEQGIRVKFLLDNRTRLGGSLQIVSKIYPAVNGTYVIYKLSFEIASRDTPFYYIAEGVRRK